MKCLPHPHALTHYDDGFGGLVVSVLASGTRVRGFKRGRRRWIFQASEKSSACLPSEGKWKNLSHVPALRGHRKWDIVIHLRELRCASKIPCIVPSYASRGLSCLRGVWRLWRWMRGTHWGKGTISLQAAVPKRPHMWPLIFFLHIMTVFHKNILELTPYRICLKMCSKSDLESAFGYWFLHHDSETAHTALSSPAFLARNKMAVIPLPTTFSAVQLLSFPKT